MTSAAVSDDRTIQPGALGSAEKPLRVGVIGSGPAGVYAAETLARRPEAKSGDLVLQTDLIDALPTPFGLIRYGVAPDHPRIKGIIRALHRILDRGDIRFLGDVVVGEDVTIDQLRERYDVLIIATGALKDAKLDIPGTQLEGFHGAADFVAWYDGNPDYPRTWDLDVEQVAVIGNGNVALDVSRMLSKGADELLATEIPPNVYEGLSNAKTTDVHVFGRRGPAQTKFSPLEARELAHPHGVQVVLDPRDFEQITEEEREVIRADKRTDQIFSTFEGWLAEQQRREDAGEEPTDRHGGPVKRRLHLHFWHRPVEVLGEDGKVTGMRFERTEMGPGGGLSGTGEMVDYDLGAVYRAVGYHGSEVPGLPYDEARGVVVNEAGRVSRAAGEPLPGLYANGWIKRGPVGLIGATKSDAVETVTSIMDDLYDGKIPEAPDRDNDSILRLLDDEGVEYTTWDGWVALEDHEIARGQDEVDSEGNPRPRVKVVERDEMVRVAREGMQRKAAEAEAGAED